MAEKHVNGDDRAAGSAQGWLAMPPVLTAQAQNQQQHVWQMAQQQQQAFQRMVHGSVSTYINLLFGAPRLTSQEGREWLGETGQGLPIEDYDELSVGEVRKKIYELSVSELTELRKYEKRHENRPTLVTHLGRKMSELNGERITKLLIARLNAKQQCGPRRKSGATPTS